MHKMDLDLKAAQKILAIKRPDEGKECRTELGNDIENIPCHFCLSDQGLRTSARGVWMPGYILYGDLAKVDTKHQDLIRKKKVWAIKNKPQMVVLVGSSISRDVVGILDMLTELYNMTDAQFVFVNTNTPNAIVSPFLDFFVRGTCRDILALTGKQITSMFGVHKRLRISNRVTAPILRQGPKISLPAHSFALEEDKTVDKRLKAKLRQQRCREKKK